jgi:hypothetical protein
VGRQMDDYVAFAEQRDGGVCVCHIDFMKIEAGIADMLGEILATAIGQVVQTNDSIASLDQSVHDVASNESSGPSHSDSLFRFQCQASS